MNAKQRRKLLRDSSVSVEEKAQLIANEWELFEDRNRYKDGLSSMPFDECLGLWLSGLPDHKLAIIYEALKDDSKDMGHTAIVTEYKKRLDITVEKALLS